MDTIEELRHEAPTTFRWWRSLRAHNSPQNRRNYPGERPRRTIVLWVNQHCPFDGVVHTAAGAVATRAGHSNVPPNTDAAAGPDPVPEPFPPSPPMAAKPKSPAPPKPPIARRRLNSQRPVH